MTPQHFLSTAWKGYFKKKKQATQLHKDNTAGGGGRATVKGAASLQPPVSAPSLRYLPASGRLHLHAGGEALGQSAAVVAQLRGVEGAGFLGVDNGGALEALGPMARLEIQLCLVVAPGAVGHGHHGLPAVFEALAHRPQGHALDEVAVRVVVHG